MAVKRAVPYDVPPCPTEDVSHSLRTNCIVFSKDRAMQLDACLRSIAKYARYDGPVTVICRATTPEFEEAYGILDRLDGVRLVRQGTDLQRDILEAIVPDTPYTVFHTDDDLFFRKPSRPPGPPRDFVAFSQRLGRNTTYCHPLDRAQPIPSFESSGPVIAWDWTRAKCDYAYPMSLDGHVFRTELVRSMITRARFANPNQLEDELHRQRYRAPRGMLAFCESCLVSIPANIVTSSHSNRAAARPEWSAEVLNRRFLAGERVDLEALDFSNVIGAHQEIALRFHRV
jgi:hypothetical protein